MRLGEYLAEHCLGAHVLALRQSHAADLREGIEPRIGVQLAEGLERLLRQSARLGEVAAVERDLGLIQQVEANLAPIARGPGGCQRLLQRSNVHNSALSLESSNMAIRPEVPQRETQLGGGSDLTQHRDTFLEQRLLLLVGKVACLGDDGSPIQPPSTPERNRPRASLGGVFQPGEAIAGVPPVAPEAAKRTRQTLLLFSTRGVRLTPGQRCDEIAVLRLEPLDPPHLIHADQSACSLFREGEIKVAVVVPHRTAVIRLLELLLRVLADGVELPVALHVTASLDHHERFVDQAQQRRQRLAALDGLNRGERESTAEHRKTPEERCLVWFEQLVTPVDRPAQHLVPRRGPSASIPQQAKAIVLPHGEVVRRHAARRGRRQLDGERDPVQPTTNPR